jgi:L-cysteine desulfidase
VKILSDYLGCGEEKMARAVCVSELVGLILAAHKNRLSALCGVFTASIGTACAWAYLLGGGPEMMNRVLNTMVGNLSGIICDGAKGTCALKLYSSLECASMSVRLALKEKAPGRESGIVGSGIAETIDNLARLCNEGMEETDNTVVSIMISKDSRC